MLPTNTVWAAFTLLSTLFFASGVVTAPTAPDQAADPVGTAMPIAAPKTWVHPGVFVSTSQLSFVKGKVHAGAQPWSQAFTAMLADPLASQTRPPKPWVTVSCGDSEAPPELGCHDERFDSMAAYMNALAFYITGGTQYAKKAIAYMNAWSYALTTHNGPNAPLQAAWSAANWVRAGELMLHNNPGNLWAGADITAFKNMIRNVYWPFFKRGSFNDGNQELVMIEAGVGAAVLLEDATIWETSMALYAKRVPAYIYLTSDGPLPFPSHGQGTDKASIISFWHGQSTFVDGLTQETCRDFAHMSYGISSISHIAETTRIQGIDLWTTQVGTWIKRALELHSPFQTGTQIPAWLCNGKIGRSMDPVVEPPYNALAFRLKESMPNTLKLVQKQRPAAIGEAIPLMIGWETVTNADNPN